MNGSAPLSRSRRGIEGLDDVLHNAIKYTADGGSIRIGLRTDGPDAVLMQINGHVVRVEHSGVAALQAAAQFLPDAVVCDLGMPGMGGCELATQFRKDRRFATMRLIAVTGCGAEEDQRRTRDAGFDHQLTKPASVENIEAILSRR
jgi:CheY-like chemotaxis protein